MKGRMKKGIAVFLTAMMVLSMAFQSIAAPLSSMNPAAASEPAKITGTWSMDASGSWRFNAPDGAANDGWYYLNTTNNATDYNWFCFDANGVMKTGWVQDKNDPSVWYYTGESKGSSEGGLVKGWITDPQDGKKYYLDPSTGIMCHGWKQISGVWYYFGESRYADRKWAPDTTGYWKAGASGKHSYGSLYMNEWTPDGYYVGSSGAWIRNYSENDNSDTPDPAPETYYTVTFDMQGHGTQIAPITNVLSGSKIAEPAAPAAEGFIFAGWYKEAACANAWSFDTDKVTNNTTIYAKWTTTLTPVDAPTAATGLIYNGMVQTGVAEATGYTVTNGKANGADTYSATAALAAGYKWSDGTTADKQISWNIAKAALTATADYKNVTVGDEAPAYTVTYTGWVNGESIGTVTPETAAVLACEYTTTSPAGEYAITFTTEPAFANYTVTAVDGKLTATTPAPTKYTVTFDLNGIEGTAPIAQTIEKDGKVDKPEDPTDTIHSFGGWYKTKDATTGALSDPWDFDNDTVTANMKLYAQWTRTLESIYTNSDIPKATNNTAPDDAWENGDGGKAFIAYSGKTSEVLYFYKKLEPSGAKQLSCRKTENFTKIGDDYVLDYYLSSSFYGKYTLHMTDSKFTSVTYDGAGTDYEVLSGTYSPVSECIAAGTMISMPGGKQKAVEELEIGDVVCTFDHEMGEVSSAPVCFIWESENVGNAFTLTFEGDIEVTVIEEHGFYDQEEQKYVFINLQNAEEYIGDHFYHADSNNWLELKSCKVSNERVDAYAIITSGNLNHMSNGMLSMCDGTVKMIANIFEYDDRMRYDADKKKADIETYGLTPIEKILEFDGFIEADYVDYNLQYLNVAIGKGLTTWERIKALSDYCVANGLVCIEQINDVPMLGTEEMEPIIIALAPRSKPESCEPEKFEEAMPEELIEPAEAVAEEAAP